MAANKIKHPLAYRGLVQVRAADLTLADIARGRDLGIEYTCINPDCQSPAMFPRAAESDKRRPHFVHFSNECRISEETILHLAAKDILRNHPQMKLPALPHSPFPPVGHDIQSEYTARWLAARDETAILGRWRADIVFTDEVPDPAFIILEDGCDTPLVIEIVVTSKVSEAKIAAVQNAGWRMIEIRIDRGAEHPSLMTEVTRDAPRRWLAHPEWRDPIRREAERLKREEEQRLAEEARRVQAIIESMEHRQPIDWTATRAAHILDCVRDYALYGHVDQDDPYAHWTAGESRWWRTHLVEECLLRLIRQGEKPVLPSIAGMAGTIRGFVIPHKRPNRLMLMACGVTKETWGSVEDAIHSFVEQGVASGMLVRSGEDVAAAPWLAELALRNQAIDTIILGALYQERSIRSARDRLRDWRGSRSETGYVRREAVIRGGDAYEAVLAEAREWRDRLVSRLPMDGLGQGESIPKPPISIIPAPMPPQRPAVLDQVTESLPKSMGLFNANLSLSGGSSPTPAVGPRPAPKSFVSAPWRTGSATPPADRASQAVQPQTGRRWSEELHVLAIRRYENSKRTRARASAMADLFMNSTNPRIGGRPIDMCKDQRTFDACKDLLSQLR